MNLLAFETVDQYKEMLHDDTFVKLKHKKWPTVGNETMKKHAYTTWQPDAPYVILLNQYRSKDNEWVKGFKGKRLCVVDGDDKPRYWEPFIDVADIYMKENSYRPTDRKNVRIGCYCPSMKVPFLLDYCNIRWKKKDIDYMFCGDMHKGRKRLIKPFKKLSKRSRFGDEHKYSRAHYLNVMSRTKISLSFKGVGDRCRREWEALLTGSMLLQDPRLKDYPFVIMEPEKHFSFKNEYNEDIAGDGYDLAFDCWFKSPSIDTRMACLYTFFDLPQMWTREDVLKAEHELLH